MSQVYIGLELRLRKAEPGAGLRALKIDGRPHEGERFAFGGEGEVRMQIAGAVGRVVAGGEHDRELAGRQDATRKRPWWNLDP